MFGLISRRKHEDLMLSKECELQYQQQKNQTLAERIQLGEDYRARLEYEIESTKRANRELARKMDEIGIELDEKKARIDRLVFLLKEKELMIGSLEARYRGKGTEEEMDTESFDSGSKLGMSHASRASECSAQDDISEGVGRQEEGS